MAMAIDERPVTTAEAFPQCRLIGEGPFENRDIAQYEKNIYPTRVPVTAKGSNGIFLVSEQGTDDRQALPAIVWLFRSTLVHTPPMFQAT